MTLKTRQKARIEAAGLAVVEMTYALRPMGRLIGTTIALRESYTSVNCDSREDDGRLSTRCFRIEPNGTVIEDTSD